MPDMYLGSQAPMYQNVHIKIFDGKTGRIRLERNAKNRITKLMLWGIAQFLSGNFNDSTPDRIYEYIPRYLAFGTNQPGPDADTAGVSTAVTVLDSRLLNEYTYVSTDGASEPVKRISIQGRQHSKINTSFSSPSIKLTLSTYVSSARFDGLEIGEAGLFSKEYDNNCLARVVFPPFKKNPGEVIDIQWEITLLSYGTTKYPETIQIEGPGKVIIPITYTPYHIMTEDTGLAYIDNMIVSAEDSTSDERVVVFEVDETTKEVSIVTDIEDMRGSRLEARLKSFDYSLDELYERMMNYKLDGWQFRYKVSGNPGVFYLGDIQRMESLENYLMDSDNYYLQDSQGYQLIAADPFAGSTDYQPVLMSYIYEESVEYEQKLTGYRLEPGSDPDDYNVVGPDGTPSDYRIIDNEVFKREEDEASGYTSLHRYLYNGLIIDENNVSLGYGYNDDGEVYILTETNYQNTNLNAYLAYDNSMAGKEYIYKIYQENNLGIILDTGYWIDWTVDKEVYNGDVDTLYHITNDNYFAIGETYKLSAYITPSDATDKSVSWNIINSNISKINQQGVLTSWNVGETIAMVSTSNDLRARVQVQVVKNSQLVLVDSLTIDPNEVTFIVEEAPNTPTQVITAIVKPVFSTYKTVAWTTDAAFDALCTLIPLGNNQARITLNNSGNVGRGRVTATTLDGKTATCLVTVIYQTDDKEDCPDPFHNEQQI